VHGFDELLGPWIKVWFAGDLFIKNHILLLFEYKFTVNFLQGQINIFILFEINKNFF